jgi:LDH2 family malate/lactate/ureidoglycolate dehydrogenase
MPVIQPDSLRNIGYQIYEACGCSAEDARIVVDHLVVSSLYGHHSHGILRFYEYVPFLTEGRFNPRGTPRVVWERPCSALVDGDGAMGQVGGEFATRLAIDKARAQGIAAVTLRNTSHIGRVGAYPLMVAREGLLGLVFCNAGNLGFQIAPFGGLDGRLSTDPIAFAAPRRDANPIMVDMATSMAADGKIRMALNRGEQIPKGWIIDAQGQLSTDPEDYTERGGAILPLGGVSGHKGTCLGFIVELLGGALSGEGVANGARKLKSNGVLICVYDIEHFTDRESFFDEVETLVAHVRSSRVDPNIGEIQLPGEPEYRNEQRQLQDGIDVDDTTWSRICEAGEQLGIDTGQWTVG